MVPLFVEDTIAKITDNPVLQHAKQKTDSAKFYMNKGDHQTAKKLIEQSISIVRSAKKRELALSNYETLILIDSLTNDYKSAFEHLKEKEKITQGIYTIQKEEIIHDLRERHHTETLQEQIEDLEAKLHEAEQDLKIRNRIAIVSILLAFIALTGGIVQVCLYGRKKQTDNMLSYENEESKHQLELLTKQVDNCSWVNQQLSQKNAVLEKSNTVKDKLLSVISHDLRSPMSSLQALLSLFNTNNIARKDLVDFFGKLLSRVENTSTMLENLLHWSQYQLSGIEPIFESVDMQKVIDDSINFYRMQAEQKHIVIDNSLKTAVRVRADVEMLKIILRNLISNALKFTHAGGIITIKALTKEGSVIVSVKDTGVGISPEDQTKMFAMANFTTLGTEKEKGTGLGLALCKDFVEHNSGKIWLDSKVNVGTTFYFSVPLAEG